MLSQLDPLRYRRQRFARGQTAAHATLVSPQAWERARLDESEIADTADFARAARELKAVACTTTGVALAPGLRARPVPAKEYRALAREAIDAEGVAGYVGLTAVLLGLIAWGIVVEPVWGTVTLGLWHIHPVLALSGQRLKPRDLWLASLLRLPLELRTWWWLLFGPRGRDPEGALLAARRDEYSAVLREAHPEWIGPRAEACPLCGDGKSRIFLKNVPDRFQNKPGRFSLDRCDDCGHIFQNPRLTPDGLSFYYRDFYEGVGGRMTEQLFARGDGPYLSRARTLRDHVRRPRRWLDVGTGLGHFACAARDLFPDTSFDGLDLSENVVTAGRRGWVDEAHHGLFPEKSAGLAGRYDVVSMFHYLEHTTDPRTELAAAAEVLAPGGHLLVEQPNPDSKMGRLLRSFYVPWFQPQHLHMLRREQLEALLVEAGFDVVHDDEGAAHEGADLALAVALLLYRLAPRPDQPWREKPLRWWGRVRWRLTAALLLAPMAVAWLADKLLAPLQRRPRWANAYRIVARLRAADGGEERP